MDKTYRIEKSHPYLETGYEEFPVISVVSGPLKGKKYQLTHPEYLIGRDPKSHIIIEDKKVSHRHAMIAQQSGQFLLCDLGSTNGAFVNNRKLDRLEKVALKGGDLIQIGPCIFQFVWQPRQ